MKENEIKDVVASLMAGLSRDHFRPPNLKLCFVWRAAVRKGHQVLLLWRPHGAHHPSLSFARARKEKKETAGAIMVVFSLSAGIV